MVPTLTYLHWGEIEENNNNNKEIFVLVVGKKHDAVLGKGKRMVIIKIGFSLQEEVIFKLQ